MIMVEENQNGNLNHNQVSNCNRDYNRNRCLITGIQPKFEEFGLKSDRPIQFESPYRLNLKLQ